MHPLHLQHVLLVRCSEHYAPLARGRPNWPRGSALKLSLHRLPPPSPAGSTHSTFRAEELLNDPTFADRRANRCGVDPLPRIGSGLDLKPPLGHGATSRVRLPRSGGQRRVRRSAEPPGPPPEAAIPTWGSPATWRSPARPHSCLHTSCRKQ